MSHQTALIEKGTLNFTVESRVLRELGERLVKEPEVAFVELVKNAHDADARNCRLTIDGLKTITVEDDGHGMTLEEFKNGWMRIGTSIKADKPVSRRYGRVVTGEKGIGRFAVRFLGTALELTSVAKDSTRGMRTRLTAQFDWPKFDRYEDLGAVRVPFTLERAGDDEPSGTTLTISQLRPPVWDVDLTAVRTASLSVVTPFHALLGEQLASRRKKQTGRVDPGFALVIEPAPDTGEDADVAAGVLDNAVLKAVVRLKGRRLQLRVHAKRIRKPLLSITDTFPNSIGNVYADIRFFPDRKGTFSELPVKGQKARQWIRRNHGVAVFDRNFRVLPYGTERDDWLALAADVASRSRDPRSRIAKKHLVMSDEEAASTQLNYMLRLPHPRQLVGIVRVEGQRSVQEGRGDEGLIAAADREGFIENRAFQQLQDLIRGAVEAIAAVDREEQLREERLEEAAQIRVLRAESRAAIHEVRSNPHIRAADKKQIVDRLVRTQALAEQVEERSRDTQEKLEMMSLLGVVAGFMTHEFGVALDELLRSRSTIATLSRQNESLKNALQVIDTSVSALQEFVTYTRAYVLGALAPPARAYAARPRAAQVVKVFGKYAEERSIAVDISIPERLMAPLVPVSLYNGICLNLFTNALKAVIARAGADDKRIVFIAQNTDTEHFLSVADTGIGIPIALRSRVFDPLFTTTASNRDPLGSGLGLGLTLVKRAVTTFNGDVEVVDAPDGFATCVRVRLPLVP
jgi:signal transduction histidine kinase